jgi:hypothetical protein
VQAPTTRTESIAPHFPAPTKNGTRLPPRKPIPVPCPLEKHVYRSQITVACQVF